MCFTRKLRRIIKNWATMLLIVMSTFLTFLKHSRTSYTEEPTPAPTNSVPNWEVSCIALKNSAAAVPIGSG